MVEILVEEEKLSTGIVANYSLRYHFTVYHCISKAVREQPNDDTCQRSLDLFSSIFWPISQSLNQLYQYYVSSTLVTKRGVTVPSAVVYFALQTVFPATVCGLLVILTNTTTI